jgi:hypothetical protein
MAVILSIFIRIFLSKHFYWSIFIGKLAGVMIVECIDLHFYVLRDRFIQK